MISSLHKNELKLYERELFLSRIASGYVRYKINESVCKLYSPNVDILYEANEIYKDVYDKAANEGVMNDDEILEFMFDNDIWTDDNEKFFSKAPKVIEDLKLDMIENVNDSSNVETIRKYLRITEKEQQRLFDIRHGLDYLSCHGAASFSKIQFIISQCSSININPNLILSCINSDFITETTMRELARTDPWRTTWACKKLSHLFNKSCSEFSDEQKRLISWSLLYDSVYESHECPSDDIVNDDDLFDGFLIKRRKSILAEKVKNEYEERLSRHGNASEVFLTVKPEELSKVSELNDPTSKLIIKKRIETIEKLGKATDLDFSDVKMQVAMMKNRK